MDVVVGQEVIFILGMARSGTSALTRVLSLCGCGLPPSLPEASQANPRGFWEPLEAIELNDEFLFRHEATLSDPTLRLHGELTFAQPETERYIGRIRAFLARCPRGPPLLIKDPRISLLLEFWLQAARAEGFRAKAVVAIRHPAEVAASLDAWVPASMELRQALWLKYNLLAELHSRRVPRVFTEYSSLLEDWRLQVARISRSLNVDLAAGDGTAVDAFLTRELYRHRASAPIVDVFGYPWLSDTYQTLADAARDRPVDVARLDGILGAYRACERAFRVSLDNWRSTPTFRAMRGSRDVEMREFA